MSSKKGKIQEAIDEKNCLTKKSIFWNVDDEYR